jgi:hypothetical protein
MESILKGRIESIFVRSLAIYMKVSEKELGNS